MEQLEKDRQAEALYNVLVNPADKRLHVYDLQNLVNYYPQSSLLYLLISRSGNQDFIKSSAVYYNSKSVFRLVNDPENRPEITPEQIIDIDHFQFNDPPPIDPLIAQNYEPTIDDLALAEINKRKFGTETEWTSYDPDETEQEQEEIHEEMYVAQLPGTQPPLPQNEDQPVAEQPKNQSELQSAAVNETPAADEGPSDEVVRMREERRRFFQSFNASHDEDADHLIDPFHLSAAPVQPPVTPTSFEPVVNEAASWNTLNFEDADPKVEFDMPGETSGPGISAEEPSVELEKDEEHQAPVEDIPQQAEEGVQVETNADQPVDTPTVATHQTEESEEKTFEEITEAPQVQPEGEAQPVAGDYQSDETWHNWDEVFIEIDEIPDPFAPVYQERTSSPVELKEESPQQEPIAEQHDEAVFEEITDVPQPEPQVEQETADEELAAANDEAVYEEIAEVSQPRPVIAGQGRDEEKGPATHDEEVYEEIAEAPKYEPAVETPPVYEETQDAAPAGQIQPGEPEMRDMYSEIDEPVYDEIAEAPRHETASRPVEDKIEAVHEAAHPITSGEPEARQMYSEIDEPVYDEIAESPVFETQEKNQQAEEVKTPEPVHQEPAAQERRNESAEQQASPVQDGYQHTEPQPAQQKETPLHHEEVYDETGGDDIFFIPPSPQGFVPPVPASAPHVPTFENKPEPVAAETVQAQPYSEDVTTRVQEAAQSAPIAEEVPVQEDINTQDESYTEYTEAEVVEETPSEEQKTLNKEPVAEFDGLIAENIVTADYFSFDRSRIKEPVNQQPGAAYTDFPDDGQQVARYHDENMPYTFLWWLDKTRREYAGTYQPYSQPGQAPQMQAAEQGPVTTSSQQAEPKNKEEEIIERFIKEEPQIKPPSSDKLDNENKARQSAVDSDELVTETLARIYTEQMLYHKAIATYKKLILRFPEKSRYFAGQIEVLENKIK